MFTQTIWIEYSKGLGLLNSLSFLPFFLLVQCNVHVHLLHLALFSEPEAEQNVQHNVRKK
jgi:hypothetical protein